MQHEPAANHDTVPVKFATSQLGKNSPPRNYILTGGYLAYLGELEVK